MKRVVLISCVKTKLDHPAKAENLYISDLFTKNLAYAKKLKPDYIFILSAKYGLLKLNDRIAPYEKTLNQMPVNERRVWSDSVISELRRYADLEQDEFIILAGEKYRDFLIPHIKKYKIPFEGLSFGNQLKALNKLINR
ncbi:MAG TPA: hypothetical protein GX730_05380 [Chloroflexi bacterium]|nr:hypothetical protein [Chloroflexota bacterium]